MDKIKIQNLQYAYGGLQVLKGIHVALEKNELVYILGRNGAGKSTLFKCMLGIFSDYTGQIMINGKDRNQYKRSELASVIAYIPQEQHQVYNYSVFDMILMGTTATLKSYQTPGKYQHKMVDRAIEIVGIQHLQNRTFHNISGGERKLVLIARAIAQEAKVILMDEPCANLDTGNQIRVMEILKTLTKQGFTVILSSHEPEQMLLYGDRVILLQDGIVKRDGKPEEVITESILKQLYDRDIRLCKVEEADIQMCVPAERLIEKRIQKKEND